MQTSSRHDNRPHVKRHAPQISISDDNYHVTEAIGDYYGKRDSRPLSFLPSSSLESQSNGARVAPTESLQTVRARNPPTLAAKSDRAINMNRPKGTMAGRSSSFDREYGPSSSKTPVRERSNSDTAHSQFPLNDIDYESNPAAVAQEMSNLQALRRMSMNANATGDPDLPSFNSSFGIPSAPPSGAADEDDRARLYWVPARIHPELAPTEFKTFIDSKVNAIKRRSGDGSLSPDGLQHEGSGGGLRRKKSMLSRQIDNSGGRGADGYQDGAERLERKKSLSGAETLNSGISNLQDLESLVNDSEHVMQRLSIDTGQSNTSGEILPGEDIPILPSAPGNSLRRSTRTTYRRGSLRKGERVPYSKRVGRASETDAEDSPTSSPITPSGEPLSLARVQTEPVPTIERPPAERVTENFSRPGRINRRTPQQSLQSKSSLEETRSPDTREPVAQALPPKHFVSQIASNGRSSISPHILGTAVPSIVETPPPSDEPRSQYKPSYVPERVSSHEPPPSISTQGPLPSANRGQKWPPPSQARQNPSQNQSQKSNQTLNDMASHPSPLPGNSTRTDSLSFIPTLTEDKKPDNKKPKDKREKDASESPRKTSWSWGSLIGNEGEKDRKKEDESKKLKSKTTKPAERPHDNARLDLLQTAMDGNRGRESLVLDRGDIKLEEERKKESSRKAAGGEGKKEKDSGLFSSLFGGGKKKGHQEATGKKHFSRNLSPEPPPRVLKPDIDYHWTRFSILEERAIYRLAHIKLANPRRPLHSQVLLSNFMYSYLDKVQQMHPPGQGPGQKPSQTAPQRKTDQPEEFYQYQKYQEQQQKQQEEEQAQAQARSAQHDSSNYTSSEGPYSEDDKRHRPQSRASQHSQEIMENGHGSNYHQLKQQRTGAKPPQSSAYQLQLSQFEEPERSAGDEMW
ncbi:MAG: hypothetical protein LQ351_006001 [Letrouitia transgressa]|nr:MAG: hypothetical protein LQ351_006001 [Letrouitia transgressa]